MSHSLKAQIAKQKRQPVEYSDEDYPEIPWQCIKNCLGSGSQPGLEFDVAEIQPNQGASDGRKTEN